MSAPMYLSLNIPDVRKGWVDGPNIPRRFLRKQSIIDSIRK